MNDVLLLLGGNLGNREHNLAQAIKLIGRRVGTITDYSSIYETAPWGFNSNQLFLNQVVRVQSKDTPHTILQKTLKIESEMGRERNSKEYGSRVIDIDILMIDDLAIRDSKLEIPHPRLHQRMFTLIPMSEIAGEWIHPVFNKKISEIAKECTDPLNVWLYRKN